MTLQPTDYAVPHISDLSAPNFTQPDNFYAPFANREAWLEHLHTVRAVANDRTLFERIDADANTARGRLAVCGSPRGNAPMTDAELTAFLDDLDAQAAKRAEREATDG